MVGSSGRIPASHRAVTACQPSSSRWGLGKELLVGSDPARASAGDVVATRGDCRDPLGTAR